MNLKNIILAKSRGKKRDSVLPEYKGSIMGVRRSTMGVQGSTREYRGSTVGVPWEYGSTESRFFPLEYFSLFHSLMFNENKIFNAIHAYLLIQLEKL
jgi:hypothetical protein